MDSLTWARNALGLRLIAMGAAIAAPSGLEPHERPTVVPDDPARISFERSPSPSATLIAERTAASGVWPARTF